MVYIEQYSAYLDQLKLSPLAPLLKEVLYDSVAEYSMETHNANEVAVSLIVCVKTGNKADAETILNQFSKRLINKDSHWIYDNFIVFSIVCAVHKFELSTDWISKAINLTYSAATPVDKKVKDTFRNILTGNYSSRGDYHQISVVYQFIAKDEKPNEARLNEMYIELWEASFPFVDDDFLNVMSLKAIEIAFTKKALLNPHQLALMNSFVPNFKKRSEIIAKIIAWMIIAIITISSLYQLDLLNEHSKSYPIFSKVLFFLLSVSGFGVSIFWGWRKGLSKFMLMVINKLFGFPKE